MSEAIRIKDLGMTIFWGVLWANLLATVVSGCWSGIVSAVLNP